MEIQKSKYEILTDLYSKVRSLRKSEENNRTKLTENSTWQQIDKLIDEGIQIIDGLIDTIPKNRLLAMKNTLLYEKSKILVNEGRENLAEEILSNSLKEIIEFSSAKEVIFLALRIINHYAYLFMKRNEYTNAREVLERGASIYRDAKSAGSVISFVTNDELFSTETVTALDACNKLERLVTSNLQMLSMVYEKLELDEKFAECQHEVLERQFEICGDELMWSIKATKLACFFMKKNRFKEARNHLAAATQVICQFEESLQSESTERQSTKQFPDVQRKSADIANGWVKYGLALFNFSKLNAMKHFYQDSNEMLTKLWDSPFKLPTLAPKQGCGSDDKKCDLESSKISRISEDGKVHGPFEQSHCNESQAPEKLWLFRKINLSQYDEGVTAEIIESTEEARNLFQHTHLWLKRVKIFYTLQEYPMEYVNTIMDLNELYRYLAFYEEDIESQYTVHKLRADALETLSAVLREVRPHCYMAISIEILRELAEVQMEMMGLNLRKIYAAQTVTPDINQTLKKIETLHDLNRKLRKFGTILPEIEASS